MAYKVTRDPRGGTWHSSPGRKVYVAPRARAPVSYNFGGGGEDPSYTAAIAAQTAQLQADEARRQAASRQILGLGDVSDAFQRQQLSNEYGLGGDTSNPYSRAAVLQANYKKSQASNVGSYAAKGQLYSGALQTAQNAATGSYNQGYDALQRSYQKSLQSIAQQRLNRYATQGQGIDDSTYASISRGLSGLGA
jgi:hypothetical protein